MRRHKVLALGSEESYQAKNDPSRKSRKRRLAGYMVSSDYEARPKLRIIVGGRPRPSLIRKFGRVVLGITKNNVRTRMHGRWAPTQYNRPEGTKPLESTEDQWTVEYKSSRQAVVRPKRNKLRIWKGHVGGMTIRPRVAKRLRFKTGDGVVYASEVKLPKRDPRPTDSQLRAIKVQGR